MSHRKHFKFWVNNIHNIWVGVRWRSMEIWHPSFHHMIFPLPSGSWHHDIPTDRLHASLMPFSVVRELFSAHLRKQLCGSCHWVDFKVFWMGFLSAGKLGVDDHPNVSMPGRSLSEFQGRLWTVQIMITMGARRMPQTGHYVICKSFVLQKLWWTDGSQFQWWRWSKGREWVWLKIAHQLQKPKVSCLMIMFPFTSMCHPGLGVNLGHSLDPKLQMETWALLVISSSAQHL